MSYTIDDNLVNDEPDWFLWPAPKPNDTRFVGYPGMSEEYAITQPAKGKRYRVTGTLFADTIANLTLLTDSYDDMRSDGVEHSFTIDDVTRTACALEDFRAVGSPYPYSDSTGTRMAIDVEFLWRQLRKEVVSAP